MTPVSTRTARVLVVSPYGPSSEHKHAAADYVPAFAGEVASRCELHFAAPGTHQAQRDFTVHSLPEPHFGLRNRFGLVPAAQRMDWPRSANAAVADLVRSLQPDVTHFEYLQAAEAGLHLAGRWTCTLHDISEKVMREKVSGSLWQRAYRVAEWLRTRRLERQIVRRAHHVFVHNPTNIEHVVRLGGSATATWMGVPIPLEAWVPPSPNNPPSIVFAGAMWREPNRLAARWLATEIMPVVWRELPTAVLRLVGHGSETLGTLTSDERVLAVGPVASIEKEYLGASVVAAPTFVSAGVLVKAQKAMACGVPVVLNSPAAVAFSHLEPSAYRLADSPAEFAAALTDLIRNQEAAHRTGLRARQLMRRHFSWSASVDQNFSVWSRMKEGVRWVSPSS